MAENDRGASLIRLLAAAWLFVPAAAAKSGGVDYRSPRREYVQRDLDDRTVFVESELSQKDPELEKKALARLQDNLRRIEATLPRPAAAALRKIPFFLMYGPAASTGGRKSGAAYHRRSAPEHKAWVDPRWRDCVVVYSARNYAHLREVWAAKVLLHELAHAWQLTRYRDREPELLAAYDHAMAKRLYDDVPFDDGSRRKAYAAANHLEYFAELSAIYFVGGNYFPFNRDGLRRHDPEGYALVEKLWGVRR